MIQVNLGCGWRNFGEGWIHIDGGDYAHIDKRYKSVELYEFANDSIDVIYTSHMIAYFDQVEFSALLKQWYRKLKRKGVLRIATPDINSLTDLYQQGKVGLKDIVGPMYGRMLMGNEWIYHKTTYDSYTLINLLEEAGFRCPKIYDWRDTNHAQFDDHSQAYLCPKGDKENGVLISLNVEVIK